jgi:hypothetical protein
MKQEPSDDEVKEFVRNDANDDDYMLFEIVAGVEAKFRVPRPEAVLLTHRAITARGRYRGAFIRPLGGDADFRPSGTAALA